jgi:hypothetical protein
VTCVRRRDWWQAIEFRRADDTRTTLCLRRYEGQSCAELAKDALFQTNIPGGDFGPATRAMTVYVTTWREAMAQ